VSSAPNGSRASTISSRTERERTTRGGKSVFCLVDSGSQNLLRSKLMARQLGSRIRLLREEPHTQKIAEAAVGLGTDNGTRFRVSAVMEMDQSNQG